MTQLEYAELKLRLRAIDAALNFTPNNPTLLKERLEVINKLVWS